MESVISIEKLSLAFERDGRRTEVLQQLDLEVRAGEFLAIVGPSGVGKSTLLRVIAGLAKPSSGTSRVFAHASALPVALVFQDARLLPWRRVVSNVGFGLEHGMKRSERLAKAHAALKVVGLIWPSAGRMNCRAASASASRLPVRLPSSPKCC
jgi:NitT/TauT family transport system ATP-binding protein